MSSHKLKFEEFDKLDKKALYKIFADLYDQKEDYKKVINIINQTGGSASGTSVQIQESSTQNFSTKTPVIREFEPFKVPEDTKLLIFGSSITARIRREKMPNDTIIHSYRGSSAEEKLKVLTKYPNSKFRISKRNYTGWH